MGSDLNRKDPAKKPHKPPPKPPPKQPLWSSFRRFRGFSLTDLILSQWKGHDIGLQDQVRWGLRLSGIYIGIVLGGAGLFWLSIPYIDEWRRKEIMSGEFQRKIREKEEKELKKYTPEMLESMEKYSARVSGNVVYNPDWRNVDWSKNWGSTEVPAKESLVDILDETAETERLKETL